MNEQEIINQLQNKTIHEIINIFVASVGVDELINCLKEQGLEIFKEPEHVSALIHSETPVIIPPKGGPSLISPLSSGSSSGSSLPPPPSVIGVNGPVNWVYAPDEYGDIVLYIMKLAENYPIVPVAVLPYLTDKTKLYTKELKLQNICLDAIKYLTDHPDQYPNNFTDEVSKLLKDGISFKYALDWTVVCVLINKDARRIKRTHSVTRPGQKLDLIHLSYRRFLLMCTQYMFDGYNTTELIDGGVNKSELVTRLRDLHEELKDPQEKENMDPQYYLRYIVPYGIGLGWAGGFQDLYTYILTNEYGFMGDDFNEDWSKIENDCTPSDRCRLDSFQKRLPNDKHPYTKSYTYVPGSLNGNPSRDRILDAYKGVDDCVTKGLTKQQEHEFGNIQRKAANHNVYLTGFRFGDNKFLTYIFDEKNKKWLTDRTKKPKGEWKSIKSLQSLLARKKKQRVSVTKQGYGNFTKLHDLTLPESKFNYSSDIQLNPVPIHAFGYYKKCVNKFGSAKGFPVDRMGMQLYPLGKGAYFRGKHQGVSSTFSEEFSKKHGLWNPKGKYVNTALAPRPQFQYGRRKTKKHSCFGKATVPNEYANNVFNGYTRKYQGGIAKNLYGYRGTQAPFGGVTGVAGYPALSQQTVSQGLVPRFRR